MQKLTAYFIKEATTKFSAKTLQEILLFYIIYFMGRRGQENLRGMKKDTFAIAVDPDQHCYIYQKVGEADKNHNENSTEEANQARIYAIPGQLIALGQYFCCCQNADHTAHNTLLLCSRFRDLPCQDVQHLSSPSQPSKR